MQPEQEMYTRHKFIFHSIVQYFSKIHQFLKKVYSANDVPKISNKIMQERLSLHPVHSVRM